MTNYVEQHEAEDLATERLVQILDERLSYELDLVYDRTVTSGGHPITGPGAPTQGVYLPDPDYIYRQTGPTADQEKDTGHTALFLGAIGDAERAEDKAVAVGSAFAWLMQQRFAAVAVFGRGAPQTVTDDFTGRTFREEEMLRKRASYYAGGMASVIFRYGHGCPEIQGVEPLQRGSQLAEIQIGQDEYDLIGVASFEFLVKNRQTFPAFGQLER